MKIGYARVSTKAQDLELQVEKLQQYGCKRIFREKISGRKKENRPELLQMLEYISTMKEIREEEPDRAPDVIVVYKLDRLARSTTDLLNTVGLIHEAGAKLVSLSEPWMDTTTPLGKLLVTICAGLAEFEADLIAGRRQDGIDRARRNGVKFGPKEKIDQEKRQLWRRLREEGKSVKEIAGILGVHRSTLYRLEEKGSEA